MLILKAVRRASALALCFAFVVLSPSSTPSGLSLVAQAQAKASDALVLKCRKAVFKRYGQRTMRSGRKVRIISSKFSIAAVDACVANGGRVV